MKILIVDDSKDILDILLTLLTSFGHEVDIAIDGFTAISQLERQKYPIMITDLKMPNMDGMQLLQYTKLHFPETEVIVATGYSKTFSYVDVIQNGAVDFIIKPFMADELEAKINRILREQQIYQALKKEIADHQLAKEALQKQQEWLENEVANRTAALVRTNSSLLKEIAERKQLEAELRESMATAMALREAPTDAILFLDPTGIILDVNHTATTVMQKSAADLIGRSLWDLLPEAVAERRQAMVASVIASGCHFVGEEEMADKWYDLVIYPILDDQGHVSKVTMISRDISTRKESEKILREKQTQLIHAGRLTALGEMATGMAHEINQPLTVIRLIADNLKTYFKKNHPQSRELESLDDMINQVVRAANLIRNMRSFARNSNGCIRAVHLPALVENSLSFFREQCRLNEIALNFSAAPDLPVLETDGQKFEQIVVNFLTNAKQAVESKAAARKTTHAAGGSRGEASYQKAIDLSLDLATDKESIIFTVQDNGQGMSAEVRNRCLEPFYTTKQVGEGTGLGLSIVYGIAKELRYEIEIESQEGEGSTFRLYIPTTKPQPINP